MLAMMREKAKRVAQFIAGEPGFAISACD